MARVALEGVHKSFGITPVVRDLTLAVEDGEFLVLLGPSGCGKTTTLRLVAGFIRPTAGIIRIADQDVTRVPVRLRNIGMVFQDYALFPNMTVAENIGFALRERRVERRALEGRVAELMALTRMEGFGGRYPGELSGGQQQRVGLARALAHSPRVLLMDEPMAALDLKLRQAMQGEIHKIQRDLGITTVLVTHDQEEALSLADRIVVMAAGRIEQIGTPEDLYLRPATAFVADFVGKINFLAGVVIAVSAERCTLRLPRGEIVQGVPQGACRIGETARLAIRPEAIRLGEDSAENRLMGELIRRRFFGKVAQLAVSLASGEEITVECDAAVRAVAGETVSLSWDSDRALVYPA